MNRIIGTTILLLTFFTISAQEIITNQSKNEYNKWSVEVNIGNNKPIYLAECPLVSSLITKCKDNFFEFLY